MAGRASIVGAAVSHVGNVRAHNEDSHFIDADEGLFVVCDGMGGHAAGEVASALAVNVIREKWASNEVHNAAARWLQKGSPESRKQLIDQLRGGVAAAHTAILEEAARDEAKTGMGTTLVGAVVVGGDCVFAHAGDSRAYLVRDGIAMQLTEDHTLLARLMAAGVEVDTTGEGSRFKSMLTNALGISHECKVSTFVVPLADGDRFLLCSDGISEYVTEAEVGEVLCKQPSPARAAQKLVDYALERGGADNATALVVRVLEAGERPQSATERKKDDAAIAQCVLYAKLSPQQRLRAQRIALPREYPVGDKLPAQTLGDRVAWIIIEGELELDGKVAEPGALIYPESLQIERAIPDREGLWTVTKELRAVALRSDDFREICADDEELGEALLDALNSLLGPLPASITPAARPPIVEAAEPVAAAPAPAPAEVPAAVIGPRAVIGERNVDPRAATDPDIQLPVPVPPAPVRPQRFVSENDNTAALVTDSPAIHAEPKKLNIRRLSSMSGLQPAAPGPAPAPAPVAPPLAADAETDSETDLDAVPTVVGPPPIEEPQVERAETEPVDEPPTPRAQMPLTLDLEPLPEVTTDVKKRPEDPLEHTPTAVKKRPTAPTPAPVPIVEPPLPRSVLMPHGTPHTPAPPAAAGPSAPPTHVPPPTRIPLPPLATRKPTPPPIPLSPMPPMPPPPPPLPLPPIVASAPTAVPMRVEDIPSASVDIVVDDDDDAAASEPTGPGAPLAPPPLDEPIPPPMPARTMTPARVISSDDSSMASGSIGDDKPDKADKSRPNGTKRSKRISEGWD